MRGEDKRGLLAVHRPLETPPRAWGRLSPNALQNMEFRNTPTCVGKTPQGGKVYDLGWKHPHVRGEDELVSGGLFLWLETPPRAWGRLDGQRKLYKRLRNTPTCVGKTGVRPAVLLCLQKHPHVRGEDLFAASNIVPQQETPPRAWGRQQTVNE